MKRFVCVVLVLGCVRMAGAQIPTPKPGDAHKILADDAGTWDCNVKMYYQGPDGPASEFKGVEKNELVSGDLYCRTTFTCQMGPIKFEGHCLTGYDFRTKEYVATWVDNFTSVPSSLKGKYDAKTKTMTMYSTVVDQQGNELKQKQVTVYKDDKSKTFTIYYLQKVGGKEKAVKLMEMTANKR